MLEGIEQTPVRPAVLNVYNTQFAIPQNYTVGILSQQFLASDNGRPDRIILFTSLAIHGTAFWAEY